MVETQTVFKADGGRDEREGGSEQERICIADRNFLLVLGYLEVGRKFVEPSEEVLVLGVGLCAESVNLFVEEPVARFSGDALDNVEVYVGKAVTA